MNNHKVILITGASSGIGKSCATFLAEKGHTVYGTSRDLAKFDDMDTPFRPLALDVKDSESVKKAVAQIMEEQGRLDVLVNNAGFALMGSIEESSEEQVMEAYNTNLFGVHRLVKEVLPIMRAQDSGWIISLSSIAGRFGLPFRGIYSSTKAALENMMEALQYEVESFGIKVSLIEPGDVKTDINEHRQKADSMNGNSPYEKSYSKAEKHIVDTVSYGLDPMEVSKRVNEAISTESPAFRYVVGSITQRLSITASHLLPNHVFRQIVKQYMKLD